MWSRLRGAGLTLTMGCWKAAVGVKLVHAIWGVRDHACKIFGLMYRYKEGGTRVEQGVLRDVF